VVSNGIDHRRGLEKGQFHWEEVEGRGTSTDREFRPPWGGKWVGKERPAGQGDDVRSDGLFFLSKKDTQGTKGGQRQASGGCLP